MSQLQPEFEQLGINDKATTSKEIRVYEGAQLPEVVQYLPMEHHLAVERLKSVPNHTVCIYGTYESVKTANFRTPKVRMLHIVKTGRVIRDARGWYFSRLCMEMPMSAVEHIFTQIIGRNVEHYDRTSSRKLTRQKMKLISAMLQFIWPVIEKMDHVVGRGVVYCWHVMLNRSSGRAITNVDLMIEDAHLHMQSKLAAMLKLSEKLGSDSGMDPDLYQNQSRAFHSA